MSTHSAGLANPISRALRVGEPILMRTAFATAGAAIAAGFAGLVALALW